MYCPATSYTFPIGYGVNSGFRLDTFPHTYPTAVDRAIDFKRKRYILEKGI